MQRRDKGIEFDPLLPKRASRVFGFLIMSNLAFVTSGIDSGAEHKTWGEYNQTIEEKPGYLRTLMSLNAPGIYVGFQIGNYFQDSEN